MAPRVRVPCIFCALQLLSTLCIPLLFTSIAIAGVFGALQGVVHGPDHRPLYGIQVELSALNSDWHMSAITNSLGEFRFAAVPVGEYVVTVESQGFASQSQRVAVDSNTSPVVHFSLALATVNHAVTVSALTPEVNPESSTTENLISRRQIARDPGADQANSMAMVTDYVPGAYVVHDQLHVRGGHQMSWLLDGVPLPNTNIASNLGPQVDPMNVDYLEVQRGGLSAEEGDRTYAAMNVVPRSGFDRNRQGEVVASYGSQNTTDDQISFGSHTQRLGYFVSLNGNRTDLGLETPVPDRLHDMAGGLGGFTSIIFNATPADQLRIVGSVRGDHYQVPNDPDAQAAGTRDVDDERDAYGILSWVHTFSPNLLTTVSPFYHFNRANYIGGPSDEPLSPLDRRSSDYLGAHATVAYSKGRHNARAGLDVFGERQQSELGVTFHDGSQPDFHDRQIVHGNVEAVFVEDQARLANWLVLNGGIRVTRYSGLLSENSADPRLGAAITLPRLNWVLRGSYSRYYQAPPLSSISSTLAGFASTQGLGFLPLHGEHDRQAEVGLAVPLGGSMLDLTAFQTRAHNFFDHDVLGNSNIFFPLTIAQARIRGVEATFRSAEFHHLRAQLAFSHQFAQARGAITGGLTDFTPPDNNGYFYLDHDQRNTLSTSLEAPLPRHAWATAHVGYGSGFLDGNGPAHLGAHASFDLALGKQLGESWSAKLTLLNVTGSRYLLDNSNTFGGTHWNNPRQVALQLHYSFHY